jgi:[acyl-carrier-protein] S-malonyltransferase
MNGSLAFVFPGQGAQTVGMLAALAGRFGEVRDTFAEASAVVGMDLWKLCQEGPEEALNLTANTQPVMLAASVALFRAWRQAGGDEPSMMAGHSLGEYSALVCSGALEFAAAVALVRRRGELMQRAVPAGEGAMAAILGLDDAAVEAACRTASGIGVVAAANYNGPGQVAIAGAAPAVAAAIEACKAAGAKRAVPLAVSAPFHCALMQPAADGLAGDIAAARVMPPRVPVVHNVDADSSSDPAGIRARLVAQIASPVQWTRCVQALKARGARTVVECGAGRVLGGLVKRIDRELDVLATDTPDAFDQALARLRTG